MIGNPPVRVVEGPRIRDVAVAQRVRVGLKEFGRDSENYQRNRRVRSLMIEVNRSLYINDDFSLCERGLEQLISTLGRLQPTLTSCE